MSSSVQSPVYSRIALDIAVRIGRGELKEGTKLSGRSLMASQYRVSPETIRRSFRLLADMQIIEVLPNSGTFVKSRENAARYIEKFNNNRDFRNLKNELKGLLNERDTVNIKIVDIIDEIFDLSERLRNTNPFYTLDFEIPDNSPVIGKTINDTYFWQNTGATVVAIKRGDKLILSPGPYHVFKSKDIVMVTGELDVLHRVEELLGI